MGNQTDELRRRIVADISSGELPPGSKLGSERELAEHYGVSRSSLRQVLAALEEAGMVNRSIGRSGGTFISDMKVERNLSGVVGVPAYLASQGYSAGSRILSTRITEPDAQSARALGTKAGDFVVDIRRIRLADGKPISLEQVQFPADRFPGLLEQPLGGSLYELLEEEYGLVPGEADERIEAVNASDDEASMLGIKPRAALLLITRTTRDESGVPFEFSRDLFRGDRTRIAVTAPGSGIRGQARRDGTVVELRA
ncbi:GntR family transcriptional regulator [Rhodococcus sp. ABRD24]|uniref:GntR family transcriptional regulator n=1 Tax=Rhodococcus sp. ABRD24 TaxID=2507582 RepID=UPI00103F64E9|nr:GntR family transcriptional regulator [Rhodococcus sp. ABRD24]QBJ96632.1 GntR family transcriptional regulator [Rhodococcus sp. ABRD24]